MKTKIIMDAIEALEDAGLALRTGASVTTQTQVGIRCLQVEIRLKSALAAEHPETKLEAA